jgi:hypothetical protein
MSFFVVVMLLFCVWRSRARVVNFPATSSDAALSIASSARLKAFLQSTDTLTVELWLRTPSPQRGGALLRLVHEETRAAIVTVQMESDTAHIVAALRVQTERAESIVNVAQRKSPVLADTWTHVAMVFDAPNRELRLLMDGKLVAEANVRRTMRLVRGLAGILLAGQPTDSMASFVGDLDEVRVWSTARENDVVARDFNRHFVDSAADVRDFGLLMYLSANGGVSLDTSADAEPALPEQVLSGGANVRAGADAPVLPRLGNATADIVGGSANATGNAAQSAPAAPVDPPNPQRDSYHARLSTSLADSHRGQLLGDIEKMDYAIDARHHSKGIECGRTFYVKWHAKVPGPLLGNALLVDMTGDGQRELAIGTQSAFVELMHTADLEDDAAVHGGVAVAGWPATLPGAEFVAAPRARDINYDGVPELMLSTQDGEIVFFAHDGAPMLAHTVKLPPARVPRDWYKQGGEKQDELSFSLYNHRLAAQGAASDASLNSAFYAQAPKMERRFDDGTMTIDEAFAILGTDSDWMHEMNAGDDDDDASDQGEVDDDDTEGFDDTGALPKIVGRVERGVTKRKTVLKDPDADEVDLTRIRSVFGGMTGGLTDEGVASLSLFLPTDNAGGAAAAGRLRRGHDALRAPLYEAWKKRTEEARKTDTEHAYVDAHILADVVVRDLDGDKRDELIVPVSYFFGREYANDARMRTTLPPGVDPAKYVASGVAVIDSECGALLWRVEFDMTTQLTPFATFVTAQPVVADINHDGTLDIVIATGAGFVYAVDSRTHKLFPNYPVALASMNVAPIVADVDDDGKVDVIAIDATGGVTRFDALSGKVAWRIRTSGAPNAKPMLGDVDGDGWLDVVFTGGDELLWAINARTGESLRKFPVRAGGQLFGDVALLPLEDGSTVVVAVGTNGVMYIVDGKQTCVDTVDVGAGSVIGPLVDDLDDDGLLDVIVATHSGDVFCFGSDVEAHPLSPVLSPGDDWTQRRHYRGIFFADKQHESFDGSLHLSGGEVELVYFVTHGQNQVRNQTVSVQLTLGPGGPILYETVLVGGGTGTPRRASFRAPKIFHTATLTLSMIDSDGHEYVDTMAVSINQHSYRLLKWLLFLPFVGAALAAALAIRIADSRADGLPLRF